MIQSHVSSLNGVFGALRKEQKILILMLKLNVPAITLEVTLQTFNIFQISVSWCSFDYDSAVCRLAVVLKQKQSFYIYLENFSWKSLFMSSYQSRFYRLLFPANGYCST